MANDNQTHDQGDEGRQRYQKPIMGRKIDVDDEFIDDLVNSPYSEHNGELTPVIKNENIEFHTRAFENLREDLLRPLRNKSAEAIGEVRTQQKKRDDVERRLAEVEDVKRVADPDRPAEKPKWRWWQHMICWGAGLAAIGVAVFSLFNLQNILYKAKGIFAKYVWLTWTAALVFAVAALAFKSVEWILRTDENGVKRFRRAVITIFILALLVWIGAFTVAASGLKTAGATYETRGMVDQAQTLKIVFFCSQLVIEFLVPFLLLTIVAEIIKRNEQGPQPTKEVVDSAARAERIRLDRELSGIDQRIAVYENEIYDEERLARAFEAGLEEYGKKADAALRAAWSDRWGGGGGGGEGGPPPPPGGPGPSGGGMSTDEETAETGPDDQSADTTDEGEAEGGKNEQTVV